MHLLLFIGYSLLCGFGIWFIPFFRKSGIRPIWLLLLFAGHVLAGCLHNIIAYRYFPEHGDVWNYFRLSFLYRHRLLSDFPLFLADNSTWTYITHNGIIYIQMLLDCFSFDNLYINTLLFSFLVFLGNVALFRVFRRRFPDDSLVATSVFWLPSVLFWTSCIYREGMLYMLLGFLFYHVDHLFTRSTRRSLFYAIALFLLIAYFRIAVAIILIPALFVWGEIPYRLSRPTRRALSATLILLFILTLSIPGLRDPLLRSITNEQASFQVLEGHSRLPLPALDGTLTSVWHTFPAAIHNGFFEPLPGSGGQPIYLACSIELLFIWGVVVLAAVRSLRTSAPTRNPESNYGEFAAINPNAPDDTPPKKPAFSTACFLLALTGMLSIGFFVPFAGTIVRYRSIYLPFLLAPSLHSLRSFPLFKSLNRWLANRL